MFEVSRVVAFATPAMGVERGPSEDAPDVVYVAVGGDKYADDAAHVRIDCEDRLALCHAACCRLRVPLSRQDIAENVTQWDPGQPYLNRQRADGYCTHCDESTLRCDVYAQRPGICRTFDCRNDRRIWVDFERRIPNPDLVGLVPTRRSLSR